MGMLNGRKKELFSRIIEEYIETAAPVGSKQLVDKYSLAVSAATVRNDMNELESEGYITQPHTSAGRTPTLKGFAEYIEGVLASEPVLEKKYAQLLAEAIKKEGTDEMRLKTLARTVADIADSAVVMSMGGYSTYYTGLTNLFRQPEFSDQAMVCSFSAVLDSLEKSLAAVYRRWKDSRLETLYGAANPFGDAAVVVGMKLGKTHDVLFAILGPLRMRYKRNIGIMRWIQKNVE